MQPKWNITGMPCKIDKKSIKLDVTDALSKEFAASDKLDIMVGKNPVQLVPVDIKIYAVNTDDFIASLVKCFDGIPGLTDLESICKEHTPEVSPSYINHILNQLYNEVECLGFIRLWNSVNETLNLNSSDYEASKIN